MAEKREIQMEKNLLKNKKLKNIPQCDPILHSLP